MNVVLRDSPLARLLHISKIKSLPAFPDPVFRPHFVTPDAGPQGVAHLNAPGQVVPCKLEWEATRPRSDGSTAASSPSVGEPEAHLTSDNRLLDSSRRRLAICGTHVVYWYHDEDRENPRNWSPGLKIWVTCVIWYVMFAVQLTMAKMLSLTGTFSLYTFIVYCASAISVPSLPYAPQTETT